VLFRTLQFKTIKARSDMTAHDCVKEAMPLWGLQGPFQLWARTFPEEPPYPLIGHERPFAVKMSRLRHMLSADEGFDLVHINNSGVDLCPFILRPVMKTPAKKNNRSKITGLLRRSLSLNTNLFGVPLSRLDENGLPKPVLVMLQQLFAKGPFMQGIFRKSANVRIVRELREQIESTGDPSCLEDAPIIAVAALLKDFLRSLPDPLLTFHLFPLWMESLNTPNPVQTIKRFIIYFK
jgi:Rho GTPase-activating protein 20